MNKIVIAITGASGSIYAKVLLDKLLTIPSQWNELSVILTENAKEVWKTELDNSIYLQYPVKYYTQQDFMAPFASGSGQYNTMIIRVECVKNSHLTVKTKWYSKNKFNSFVAPGPKHTFQVEMFNFKYERAVNFQSNPPPPHGLIFVDVFTKQIQIVPLRDKKATSWKVALDTLIDKMGRPKIIMTDPDASITSNEISEWFKRHPDAQHAMTRH